jgi:hypothetical protein
MNEVTEQTRTCQTKFIVTPNNKCGFRTNQNKGQDLLLL